ncbi:MAG: Acetyl-coenzyme A carboxylase carboxyl transferase subunit alpha [Candidatus Anoxychlamydiales bacterium]|nr:Acetyl-coenzyme A carboxylase carboxyl transferase subunit alpha [Candidatus Anoxychlamydiales bacterium]
MTILPHEKQIYEYEEIIKQLKDQNKLNSLWSTDEIEKLEDKFKILKEKVYSEMSSWDRILISRHPKRPHSLDYIKNISDEYVEIFGDRLFSDDKAVVVTLATINKQKFIVIGQEKGKDTESRLKRNFGMLHPEGFRKALRAMKLAEKFNLPVITLLDTPGAYPGLTAEKRGQGWAIAKNLFEMSKLQTQIIVIIIGEGCSGGALGMGIGDIIGMMEHAYYSVISPEGCASILYKDVEKNEAAAKSLKLHAEDLIKFKIIDEIIKEPLGGAHLNNQVAYDNVKEFILSSWENLKNIPIKVIIEKRYNKFRKMGIVETL